MAIMRCLSAVLLFIGFLVLVNDTAAFVGSGRFQPALAGELLIKLVQNDLVPLSAMRAVTESFSRSSVAFLGAYPAAVLTIVGGTAIALLASIAEYVKNGPDQPTRKLAPSVTSTAERPGITQERLSDATRNVTLAKSQQSAGAPTVIGASDREFLPAALEILLTPPSPIATRLLLLICAVFCSALVWSYFGWIDIHAVAQGKIQPSGRTKVVQPLEPGKVVAIRVENGAHVNAGDILLELDPTETAADRDAQARDLEAASAEAARRTEAVKALSTATFQSGPIAFEPNISATVRDREQRVLLADLAQLKSVVASLKAQLAEKRATKERLAASIAARQRLIALAKERVGMREEIDARGAGSRAMIIEALQQYESQLTIDAGERGQLLEMDAAIDSLQRKIEESITQFVADQTQRLAEIERKRERLVQELVKAQSKSDRTQLRAPIDGTVQQLNVSTVGQVVSGGQSLLTVVPIDGPIEVEVLLANKDIGFVKIGQPAVVKVEAFPFTRYGTIEAEVVKISRDAVDDRDAVGMTDAATAARPQGGSGQQQTSRSQNLVFPSTLRLARRTLQIDGEEIRLSPGMAVTVEIKTGRRRAIDFVMSPLREMAQQIAHER